MEEKEIVLHDLVALSEKLKLSKQTITTLIKSGKLRGKKFGRKWFVSESALREYFEED